MENRTPTSAFFCLPMVDPVSGVAFHRQSNDKVLLVCAFSSKQEQWFDLECVNVHDGKKYKMLNCKKNERQHPLQRGLSCHNSHIFLIQYRQHPEAKSLAPDGTRHAAEDTRGLLKRAHVVAGEIRYVGKETDRKWEEGDEIGSLRIPAATEYGRKGKVIANEDVKTRIQQHRNQQMCSRKRIWDRKNFMPRKLVRGLPVKRNSYDGFVRWLCTMRNKRIGASPIVSRLAREVEVYTPSINRSPIESRDRRQDKEAYMGARTRMIVLECGLLVAALLAVPLIPQGISQDTAKRSSKDVCREGSSRYVCGWVRLCVAPDVEEQLTTSMRYGVEGLRVASHTNLNYSSHAPAGSGPYHGRRDSGEGACV